jgi:hypothetical protein
VKCPVQARRLRAAIGVLLARDYQWGLMLPVTVISPRGEPVRQPAEFHFVVAFATL